MGYGQAFNLVYFIWVVCKCLLVLEVFPNNVRYFVCPYLSSLIPATVFFSTREGQLTKLPETKKTLLFTFNGKRSGVRAHVCVSGGALCFIGASHAQVLSSMEDSVLMNDFRVCNGIIDWLTSKQKAVMTLGHTDWHIVIIIGYSILLLLILVHTRIYWWLQLDHHWKMACF